MRFVLAIVAFAVAALMTAGAIAARTVFLPADHLTAETTVSSRAPYVMIPGRVLNANPGQQTLLVDGSERPFVAYGRTADVQAWLEGETYASVGFTKERELNAKLHAPKKAEEPIPAETPSPSATASPPAEDDAAQKGPEPGPNPAGSDLWLEQFAGDAARITKMNVPDSVSVIVASDGTKAAPSSIRIVWPTSNSTPWVGPLLVGAGLFFILGFVLYLLALRHSRRSRGPRRGGGGGGPKMPRLPKSPRYQPTGALEPPGRGRRAISRSVAATTPLVVGALLLTGCSSEYWPQFGAAATPSPTSAPLTTELPTADRDAPPPAVTVPQLERILHSIGATATQADASRDAALAETRFAGPALADRKAFYATNGTRKSVPPPIPEDPDLTLALPQATTTWPRTVMAVVENPKAEKEAPPVVLVMSQQSPHENYQVSYAMSLAPDPKVPTLPPAAIGDSLVPPDTGLLVLPPNQVGPAYADVLLKGDQSEYFGLFEAEGDTLRELVGPAFKQQRQEKVPDTASLTFSNGEGSAGPVAMATNNSGALLAANFVEYETIKPTQGGALVFNGEDAKALSGIESSKTGLQSTYGYQVLFYVPPGDSDDKIRVLGFATGLIASQEVQ